MSYSPLSEHASPPSEGEQLFVGDFWLLHYPESRVLVTSSEIHPPCRKIPGATPAQNIQEINVFVLFEVNKRLWPQSGDLLRVQSVVVTPLVSMYPIAISSC